MKNLKVLLGLFILSFVTCQTPTKSRDCCLERETLQKKEEKQPPKKEPLTRETASIPVSSPVPTSPQKELKKYPPEKKLEWEKYHASLERNCPYSSLPSKILASCNSQYRTYYLDTQENQDIYYYGLLNSKDYVRRRKAYNYYRTTCNDSLPMVEILEEKLNQALLDWEKKEIQDIVKTCKGTKTYTQTYFPGGLSFHPEYPNGNADLNFYYTNETENSIHVHYTFFSNNHSLLMPLKDTKNLEYEIPPHATLDEDIPLFLVGYGPTDLKVIRTVYTDKDSSYNQSADTDENSTKEFSSSFQFDSIGKAFSPRFWDSDRPYPIYYFSNTPKLRLTCIAKDEEQNLISKSVMHEMKHNEEVLIYECDLPLNGYRGWVTTEILEE